MPKPVYKKHLRISLDTETTGIDLHHGAMPFLVTICEEDSDPLYWEWDVDPYDRIVQYSEDDLFEISQWIDRADTIVLHHSKFDLAALKVAFKRVGLLINWPWNKIRDTLMSSHMLASNQPHDLTTNALIYLGKNIKKYEDAIDEATKHAVSIAKLKYPNWRLAKKGEPDMPSLEKKVWKADMWLPRAVAIAEGYEPDHPWYTVLSEYACCDSYISLMLDTKHQELVKERQLGKIFSARMAVVPVVHRMEEQGITINGGRLTELETKFTEESQEAADKMLSVAKRRGYELNLPKAGNNNSLLSFVFDELKLPTAIKTESGSNSLNAKAIEIYQATLPQDSIELEFVSSLRAKRQRDTALSYMSGYRDYWLPLQGIFNKRIKDWYILYPSLNPTGTDTLRFSSARPNEQNISKKEGFNLRYAFGPVSGQEWWSIDYENLELKIPAYEIGEQIMIDIFEKPNDPPFFGSYHLLNASIVYPDLFWPIAEIKGEFKKRYASTWYQWIKNFGFAVGYGAMLGSGTADRAAHKEGAQKLVMDRLTETSKLNNLMITIANNNGFVETIPDTEIDPDRGYPLMCTRSRWGSISPTVPLNYHVQGTACWIMMRAMVKVQEYLDKLPIPSSIVMNIHDELVIQLPFKNDKGNLPIINEVSRIMGSLGDCVGIPLTCGITYHPYNWADGE